MTAAAEHWIERLDPLTRKPTGFPRMTVAVPRGIHWPGIRALSYTTTVGSSRGEGFYNGHLVSLSRSHDAKGFMKFIDGPTFDLKKVSPVATRQPLSVFSPAGWPHHAEWEHKGSTGTILELSPDVVETAASSSGLKSARTKPDIASDLFVYHIVEALNALGDEPAMSVRAEALALALASHIVNRGALSGRPREYSTRKLSSRALAAVDDYVMSHLDETVSLSDLSAKADMSLFHFSRSFKQTTGMTPHTYVMHRRIDRACHLLRTTTMPIVQVALACGFSQQSHFTRCFRRIVRQTPGEFRSYGAMQRAI